MLHSGIDVVPKRFALAFFVKRRCSRQFNRVVVVDMLDQLSTQCGTNLYDANCYHYSMGTVVARPVIRG